MFPRAAEGLKECKKILKDLKRAHGAFFRTLDQAIGGRLGGILSNEGVLGYDEGVWNDEGNRQRLLDMLKAHAAELRAWASDAGVRLPSAESAGELREQVRDLPQEPQIQEQPGYGYQPGFQQPQQWQQQPWN